MLCVHFSTLNPVIFEHYFSFFMADSSKIIPETIEQAVDRLIDVLSLREKSEIVKMEEENIPQLHQSVGVYIRSEITHWSQNKRLLDEAHKMLDSSQYPYLDVVSCAICLALWRKLQKVHALRLIK